MSLTAKCQNYTGCLLAYRGEEIQLSPGAPLICPECGKPIERTASGAAKLWKIAPWIVLFALIVGGAIFAFPLLKKHMDEASSTPAPAESASTPAVATETPPATPVPTAATPAPGSEPVAATPAPATASEENEPPVQPVRPKEYQMDVNQQETKAVRDEVLRRIDLMPTLSQVNKDKLYNSVERARKMGLVLSLPFASGRASLAPNDIQALKTALEVPEIMTLRDDPTAVFVVLGYADSKGDEKDNLRVSQKRAEVVEAALREKCGIGNVTHSVGMGGTKLHDAQNLEKNRLVEIWAVLP